MGYENQNTSKPSTSAELPGDGKAASSSVPSTNKLKAYDSAEFKTSADRQRDEVGTGSSSVVIRCRHPDLGTVAVKCFGLTGSSHGIEQRLNNAEEEARKLSVVQHPHIVEVLGFTRWRHHYGIILEEVKGGNLEDLLLNPKIEHISWRLRLRMCLQIVEALVHLHNNPSESKNSKKPCMQHADLKPQNILLTESVHAKLADFSAAVVARASGITETTRKGHLQFTPYYSPPEFFTEKKCCDIYSFGMTLYEIITRKQVYADCEQGSARIIQLIKDTGVKPNPALVDEAGIALKDQDRKIFLGLKKIMTKCYENDPKERPSASQVLEMLRDLASSLNIGKKDLLNVDIPCYFKKLSRKSSCSKYSKQKKLSKVAISATQQLDSEDETEEGEGGESEGEFLALNRGTLLKCDVKSKTITVLQGNGELNGALLNLEDEIYIIDAKNNSDTIKKLNFDGNNWSCTTITSSDEETRQYAAVTAAKDTVFIVGGLQEKMRRETGVQYNLANHHWSHIRDMYRKRQGHVLLEADGVLYALGGYESNSVEAFDLDGPNEGWNEMQPMTHERCGLAAVERKGKIFALGGYDNGKQKLLSTVEIFDLESKRWETGASMVEARCWHDACVIGRRIYVAGGETNIVESYDPCEGSWKLEIEDDKFKGVQSIVAL